MADGSDAVLTAVWSVPLDFFAAGASFEVAALHLRLFVVVDQRCGHVCCKWCSYGMFLRRLRIRQ